MTSTRLVFRRLRLVASACTLAFTAVRAAPPPAISGLVGEWSGESSRTTTGEPVARAFSDARRYWVEGDAVRGEILVGTGNSLQTVHVAIVPRLGHFLKTVTAENGRTDLLVGLPAENGVLWSPLAGDKNRFVERVTGEGDERRLELLVPEGDPATPGWRVIDSLQPAAGAMSGVVGGGVAAPENTGPLRLPSESELALIDRVADLLLQRDAARGDTANLARELATAWREGESAGARAHGLDNELAELKAKLAAASAPAESDATRARIEAAEKDAAAARRWADELEKSLRSALSKAEEAAARSDSLQVELAAARENETRVAAEHAVLAAGLATSAQENEAHGGRVAELEATVRELQQRAAATEATLAEAAQARQTVARVDEVERALTAVQSELDAAITAREQTLREAAAATTAKAQLEERIAGLQAELAAANTRRVESEEQLAAVQKQLAMAEEQQRTAESRVATAAGLDTRVTELERALQAATATVAEREGELARAASARDADRAHIAQLEEQLTAAQSATAPANDAAARLATVEQELLAVRDQLTAAGTQRAQLEEERDAATQARIAAELQSAAATAARNAAREQLAAGAAQQAQTEQNVREADAARQRMEAQLAAAIAERDAAQAKVGTLEARIEAWAKDAPPAAEGESGRIAALEEELNSVRGQLATVTTQGEAMSGQLRTASDARDRAERELSEIRQTMEVQLAEARKAAGPSDAEAIRGTRLEGELTIARAEVALAQSRQANLERELSLAREAAESAMRASQQSEIELGNARLRLSESESELAAERARLAAAESEPARAAPERTTDARVLDLEGRLAASVSRMQERQDEIDRLNARIRELEGVAPRVATTPTFNAPASPAPASLPTAPRNIDATTRDRRTTITPPPASTPAPARPTPRTEVATTSPASTATATDAPVSFRLSASPPRASAAPRLPPTRPADNRVFVIPTSASGSDSALARAVRALPVNGYRSGPNSVVIINGRPYKPGDIVDAGRGLRFSRVENNAIVFTGPAGAEYRFQL